MDRMVEYLSERLDQENLSEKTDIIILSDHGMDAFTFHNDSIDGSIINLHSVVSEDSCQMHGLSPVLQVVANEGYDQNEICDKLKKGAAQNGHYEAYTDDELDKTKWFIRNEDRFGPCTVVAHPGYVFQDMRPVLEKDPNFNTCK